MSSNPQKTSVPSADKLSKQPASLSPVNEQDERYPGTFFRVPGVPMPGKTTWSLAK
ncbi:hypothetical protein KEF85_01910 [Methylomonas paludis]|uniref:Uncharacterized protein n=1 Tax=Methylomonas paludis TaxID=1173101 RepID=A0A975MNW8_9GAMM|nr:hypothetical protein [Methylomonas paludis]QWF71272.1 hypothetical protein KEF85_01910 [Methylomonas paludis]